MTAGLVVRGHLHPIQLHAQQLQGHWTAWWDCQPETAFGGATPAEAVDRLLGFVTASDEQ